MYNLIQNRKPYKIFLSITNRCNMNCPYCFSKAGNGYRDLPGDVLQEIIRQMVEEKIYAITITGGEPLMRDDFEDLMSGFAAWQILSLNTNAMLVDKKIAKYIMKRFHSIMVSIDGPEEIHDSVRGRGSFEKASRGIHNLMEVGQEERKVFINCTVTKHNKNFIKEIIEIALFFGVPRINFGECLYAGRNLIGASDQLAANDKIIVANTIHRLADQYRDKINVTTDYFDSYLEGAAARTNGKVLSCGAGITSAAILYNGQMVPCSLLGDNCMSGDFVQDLGIRKIWNSSQNFCEWRKLREVTMQDICPECANNSSCLGGCRAEVFLKTGNLYAKNPKHCLEKNGI